jgi:FkbM family methyltransferase
MVEHNQLENVALHPIALGATESELELRIPRGNAGGASLVRSLHTADFDRCVVPVRTLSSIAATSGIEQVRLIKIDVEGFEPEVFQGSQDLLSRQVPDAILFELNLRTTSTLKEEPVIKLLAKSGYRFLAIPKALFRTRVQPFDVDATNELPGHDVLAIARDQRHDEICARVGATV